MSRLEVRREATISDQSLAARRVSRRAVLATLVVPVLEALGCGFDRKPSSQPAAAELDVESAATDTSVLRRAAGFLWNNQADDGGWHSETYGLMRSGQALTPFVLHALLQVPEHICSRPATGASRALDFIRQHTNDSGVLGLADDTAPEYPNYATAFALRCLLQAGTERDRPMISRMRAYLVSEQFRDENGFSVDSPAFGGWGFGGRRPPGSTGHMDLSHTRHILEVLRDAGTNDLAVFDRAQVFLRFLQKHPSDPRLQPAQAPPLEEQQSSIKSQPRLRATNFDGGFYFSPIVLAANKAGVESGDAEHAAHFRSYATATCDGTLALLAAGVARDDERMTSARRWLEQHPRLDYPEGIPTDQHERWGDAIFFYHLAVRSEVYAALNWPGDWGDQIVSLLAHRQLSDGSFVNTANHLMKEDDPLLATSLCAIALARVAVGTERRGG